MKPLRLLFVCLGNICRSPTVEAVCRQQLRERGWLDKVEVDSAGTAGYHIGEPPEPRTVRVGESRGYALADLRARQVQEEDFQRFDYILGMDASNVRFLQQLNPQTTASVELFLQFVAHPLHIEIPDPYYGRLSDFQKVVDLAEEGARRLLDILQKRHPELLGE